MHTSNGHKIHTILSSSSCPQLVAFLPLHQFERSRTVFQ
uniref:Uncharacterized protein n=1 Tax=Arundo donax TaxID=35708 RepID=A0A0A9EH40_ARUDO